MRTPENPRSDDGKFVPVCEHGTMSMDEHVNHKKVLPGEEGSSLCDDTAADVEGVLNDDTVSIVESKELVLRNDLIFIVDDCAALLRTMKRSLHPFEGMEIRTFADGQQVLDEIEKTGELPTVILSDYQMPNLDGLQLCNEMKKIDASKRPLVVVVTGTLVKNVYGKFMEAGAFAVLQKPFLRMKDVSSAVKSAHAIRTYEKGA